MYFLIVFFIRLPTGNCNVNILNINFNLPFSMNTILYSVFQPSTILKKIDFHFDEHYYFLSFFCMLLATYHQTHYYKLNV